MADRALIVQTLLTPGSIERYSLADWDIVVRQGRRANLLARLTETLSDADLLEHVPDAPRRHLISAQRMVDRQNVSIHWELRCLQKELHRVDAPIVLLKGAAYVMTGIPAGRGRTFSDIDILVPKSALDDVESELMLNGWQGTHLDAYDQKYYRRWMHEIPPLVHVQRQTSLDVHHAILPETARIKVNTPALLESIVPLEGHPGLFVLKPEDMFLHSATHLFHEGQLDNGLRDLFDLDSLIRHFGKEPNFWKTLVPRARQLGLTRPLYYALRYTRRLLDSPIPPEALRDSELAGAPPLITRAVMDWCYQRALQPSHVTCDRHGTSVARTFLYVRSHWIRMPMHLLAPHLLRKALAKPAELEDEFPNAVAEEHRESST